MGGNPGFLVQLTSGTISQYVALGLAILGVISSVWCILKSDTMWEAYAWMLSTLWALAFGVMVLVNMGVVMWNGFGVLAPY